MNGIKQKKHRMRIIQQQIIPEQKNKIAQLSQMLDEEQRKLRSIEKELADIICNLQPKEKSVPTVSDHALIRYMERAHGISFDNYRKEILTPDRINAINMGCKEIKCNGVKFKIHQKNITTVI